MKNKVIALIFIIGIILTHGFESTIGFKIDGITIFLLLLGVMLFYPEILSRIREISIPNVGTIKFLEEKVERLEAFKEVENATTPNLIGRIVELEKRLEELSPKEDLKQNKEQIKNRFESLAKQLSMGIHNSTLNLKDRTKLARTLQIEGSKIDDPTFLIEKLEKGNLGERIGAATALKVIKSKDSLDLLLNNMDYSGPKGSFVRYRVAEAIYYLLMSKFFDESETEKIKNKLIDRKNKEKNRHVKKYIEMSLTQIERIASHGK